MPNDLTRFHFVGIGGIGMAALAELMHRRGHRVTGSDLRATPTTDHLTALGVKIAFGHAAGLVGDADIVVRSSAIPEKNVELAAARAAQRVILGRGELLAQVMQDHRSIAIAGSHGKTTTSAMTAHLLTSAGCDPTALIGGRVPLPGGGASPARRGEGDWLVAEVDESDGSFLLTRPEVAIITNIDPEHLDHYGDADSLDQAFVQFANRLPPGGLAILGIDHPGIKRIAPRIESKTLTYGAHEDADFRLLSVATNPEDQEGQIARASWKSGPEITFRVPMPGEHNVLNALAALAAGLHLGLPISILTEALSHFPGVARRFEHKGEAAGIRFVDDYAHHPAEVAALLNGARSIHPGRIVAIFQPHRYTRTRDCWDEFLSCFTLADRVVISEVYSAGETPIDGIGGAALAEALCEHSGLEASFGGDLDQLERELPRTLKQGDLVLTLGAGDIVRLGPRLCRAIEQLQGGDA